MQSSVAADGQSPQNLKWVFWGVGFFCLFVSLFAFLALIKLLCLSVGQFSSLPRSILNTHLKL